VESFPNGMVGGFVDPNESVRRSLKRVARVLGYRLTPARPRSDCGPVARPRAAGVRRTTAPTRGPTDDDPHPEPSALNRSWQVALEELETATEFETLGELARIRSIWIGRAA
jgi:hypothetical protein